MALLQGKPMSKEWLDSVRASVDERMKGMHYMNLLVRRNGQDEYFEGDWVHTALNYLLANAVPLEPEADEPKAVEPVPTVDPTGEAPRQP